MNYFVPHNEFNLLSHIHETNCKRFAIEKWPPKFSCFLEVSRHLMPFWYSKLWNAISCQPLCGLLKTMNYFVPHNEFNLLSPIHETNCKRFAIEKWPQNLIVFLKLFDIWFHFETKTLECYILSTTLQFYVNHGLICSAQRVQPFISYPWNKLQTFCHRKVTPKV